MTPEILAEAAELIAHFEDFRARPYRDSGGVATIGYGTTRLINGQPVTMRTDPVSEPAAQAMMVADIARRVAAIEHLIPPGATDGQVIAAISFCYNCGTAAFQKSTLLRLWRAGNIEAAANEFSRWVFGGGRVLPGLVTRRAAERALFLGPPTDDEAVTTEALNNTSLRAARGTDTA